MIFSGYLGSVLLAGAYLSIGMFTSALSKNQVISFIVAVVIGLFLILAGFPPVTDFLSDFLPANIVDGIAGFSFVSHFETLQRGIIDLRDLFYFASVIVFSSSFLISLGCVRRHVAVHNERAGRALF